MGRSIDPSVWDRWRDRLGRFETSDLTVAAFCKSEGVSQAGFYQWRKKLGRSAGRQRDVARQRHRVTATPPAFCASCPGVGISGCRSDSDERRSCGGSVGRS